jgi:hypothetical protein
VTQGDTIYISSMDAKADDAPSELIHDDEYPVAIQMSGFTPKQMNVPEAVLRVSLEG